MGLIRGNYVKIELAKTLAFVTFGCHNAPEAWHPRTANSVPYLVVLMPYYMIEAFSAEHNRFQINGQNWRGAPPGLLIAGPPFLGFLLIQFLPGLAFARAG